jgi:hypothetical protein
MKELYTYMLYLIPVVSMVETCTGYRSCLQAKRFTSYSSTDAGRLAIITSLANISGSSSKQRNIVLIYIHCHKTYLFINQTTKYSDVSLITNELEQSTSLPHENIKRKVTPHELITQNGYRIGEHQKDERQENQQQSRKAELCYLSNG